jgi:ribonuclease HI
MPGAHTTARRGVQQGEPAPRNVTPLSAAERKRRQRERIRSEDLIQESGGHERCPVRHGCAKKKPRARSRKSDEGHYRAISGGGPTAAARPQVNIYTDGACVPNPGRGAWAALLRFVILSTGEVIERELSGYDPATTNNRMEMMAAICGLEALSSPSEVTLYTDSRILQQGTSGAWKRKANLDLWQRLDRAAAPHQLSWKWVRGHGGHCDNIRVDRLAAETLKRRGLSPGGG